MLPVSLLVASFVIFAALYLAPGNAIAALSGGQPLPPGSVQVLEQRYHLNDSFVAQYWYWLDNAVRGNLGISITLREKGYPFCLEIDAEYRLDPGTGLRVAVTARNRGSRAAPYGTGSHPYLTVRTPSVDECELTLPAARWLPMDDRGIPSGPPAAVEGTPCDFRQPRPIGATRLDHALTGLARDGDGRAWAYLAAGGTRVGLWAGQGYRWLQVFTGDPLGPGRRRKAVAVEPMTCPPNAFVTGDDLLVLQPGETITHTWGIQAFAQ